MNHWLVAELGWSPSFAMAMVPRMFVFPGSFWICAKVGTLPNRSGRGCAVNPPPWSTKFGIDLWIIELTYLPALT